MLIQCQRTQAEMVFDSFIPKIFGDPRLKQALAALEVCVACQKFWCVSHKTWGIRLWEAGLCWWWAAGQQGCRRKWFRKDSWGRYEASWDPATCLSLWLNPVIQWKRRDQQKDCILFFFKTIPWVPLHFTSQKCTLAAQRHVTLFALQWTRVSKLLRYFWKPHPQPKNTWGMN